MKKQKTMAKAKKEKSVEIVKSYLKPAIYKKFKRKSEIIGVSMSEIIREIIKDFLSA